MPDDSGRLIVFEQQGFSEYANASMEYGVNLVTVGRFDRMNLFLSTTNRHWAIFDNGSKTVLKSGSFPGTPIAALGSADDKMAYVALDSQAQIAVVDLEDQKIVYIAATDIGSGAFTIGLSNNVCH